MGHHVCILFSKSAFPASNDLCEANTWSYFLRKQQSILSLWYYSGVHNEQQSTTRRDVILHNYCQLGFHFGPSCMDTASDSRFISCFRTRRLCAYGFNATKRTQYRVQPIIKSVAHVFISSTRRHPLTQFCAFQSFRTCDICQVSTNETVFCISRIR